MPGVSAPPNKPLDTTVSLLTISSGYPGPPEATPHTAGKFNPPMLDMAIPPPTPRSPPPNPCHAPPPLSLNGRVLVLTTSILVAPPPPPPAILTPLSHFSLFTFPPPAPQTGVPYFLYSISHLLTLYPPLLPFSCYNSSFRIVPSECMAGGQIFSLPPQPPATTPNQLRIILYYLTSSPKNILQKVRLCVEHSPRSK